MYFFEVRNNFEVAGSKLFLLKLGSILSLSVFDDDDATTANGCVFSFASNANEYDDAFFASSWDAYNHAHCDARPDRTRSSGLWCNVQQSSPLQDQVFRFLSGLNLSCLNLVEHLPIKADRRIRKITSTWWFHPWIKAARLEIAEEDAETEEETVALLDLELGLDLGRFVDTAIVDPPDVIGVIFEEVMVADFPRLKVNWMLTLFA